MKSAEGEKVGQIRKRVQDLSWKQRKEGDRDALDEDKDGEGEEEEASVSESRPAVKESSSPKRTQPSFASYSSKPSAFASAKREDAASPPVSALDEDKTTASPPNGRTQPTFSSFSKSSSPFNSMSSVAGPSWLAGKSGSGSPASGGGGLRPSALGSVGSSNKPSIDAKEAFAPASSQEEKSTGPPSSGSKQLGFGAFSSNKTFSARSSTPTNATDGKVNGDDGEDTSTGKSFDEVLKQGNDNDEDEVVASKVSTQLPQGHADLKTGEEDEKTLTSARGKLYTMTEDKNWKERGTGTVRCNILKEKETSARLGE
jgi:Ran-binding protein 3